MFPKIIKALWAISIIFNFILLIDWYIVKTTGYFIFRYKPRHELALQFIGITVFCTTIAILISLCRIILSLRRNIMHKKIIISFLIFPILLLYTWHGLLSLYIDSMFNFSAIVKTSSYSSPSHQKMLMFNKTCYFINCLNEAYEVKGIFQRRAYINQSYDINFLLSDDDFRNEYFNAFHDLSKIQLKWNKDETIVKWKVEVESEEIRGIVYFYK